MSIILRFLSTCRGILEWIMKKGIIAADGNRDRGYFRERKNSK